MRTNSLGIPDLGDAIKAGARSSAKWTLDDDSEDIATHVITAALPHILEAHAEEVWRLRANLIAARGALARAWDEGWQDAHADHNDNPYLKVAK